MFLQIQGERKHIGQIVCIIAVFWLAILSLALQFFTLGRYQAIFGFWHLHEANFRLDAPAIPAFFTIFALRALQHPLYSLQLLFIGIFIENSTLYLTKRRLHHRSTKVSVHSPYRPILWILIPVEAQLWRFSNYFEDNWK